MNQPTPSLPSSSAPVERPSSPRKAYNPSTVPTWLREGSKHSQQANTWGAYTLARDFVCDAKNCSQGFKTEQLLQEHVKRAHRPFERKYACPFAAEGCKKRFPYRQNVESHVKISHPTTVGGELELEEVRCAKNVESHVKVSHPTPVGGELELEEVRCAKCWDVESCPGRECFSLCEGVCAECRVPGCRGRDLDNPSRSCSDVRVKKKKREELKSRYFGLEYPWMNPE
ncbi:hypothetical protein DFP72DRAFT_844306 [Ephemerocybe angulata]|uniref:C2H2-type domain-containing protein n=1 Tax=Ephemerocybe angulata TaxID=980116 RepID=A0A8H6I646_9AGAR|nr:hypothetical protein DFP72DRAFT_844306 [Tulosesus angulatus]